MAHYLDFELFASPDLAAWQSRVSGSGRAGVLVVMAAEPAQAEADLAFLETVLTAAKLSPVADQVFLLSVSPQAGLPVVRLSRQLGVSRVMIFGLAPQRAGLRAEWPPYTFTRLGELRLLWGHAMADIKREREAGDSRKAGALWQALKTNFLP